jgi:membrane protease subunit HflK
MKYIVLVLVGIGLIYTAATAVTQVQPGERGVVRRFGRVIQVTGSGLHIGLPWGIDRVYRENVDFVRRVTIGFTGRDSDDLGLVMPAGQLLTGDHNLVDVQVVVEYAVKDNEVEQFVLYGDQRADGLVARAAETVLTEWVAGRGINEVLLSGKQMLPGSLVAETQRRIEPYRLGVQIQVATVSHLSPPSAVKPHFDAVTQAQAEIQTRVHKANQDANDKLRKAEAEKDRRVHLAVKNAEEVKGVAAAVAMAFEDRLKKFRDFKEKHPDYQTALWWEKMTGLLSRIQETGRIEALDHRLAPNGMDILQYPGMPKKK